MDMVHAAFARPILIASLLCVTSLQTAWAATSRWEDADGARLRIVTEPLKPGMATLRGVLQVDLEPGWKTYWREPGSSGIPPQVSASGAADGVTIHFPVPVRIEDEYGSLAGYKEPVALPLTFTLAPGGGDDLDANVFLGICREVCVPVSARFTVPLASRSGATLQAMQVDAAFAALPGPGSDALSISAPSWSDGKTLEIRLDHVGGEGPAGLFLSAGVDHPFGAPRIVSDSAEETVIRAEALFDPAKAQGAPLVITARRGIDTAEIATVLPKP